MYQINWTAPVLDSLVLFRDHRDDSLPRVTHLFLKQITEATSSLELTPERGRLVFETDYQRAIRELLFNDFRIIYRIHHDQIDTLAVIHARKHLIGLGSMCSKIRSVHFIE